MGCSRKKSDLKEESSTRPPRGDQVDGLPRVVNLLKKCLVELPPLERNTESKECLVELLDSERNTESKEM